VPPVKLTHIFCYTTTAFFQMISTVKFTGRPSMDVVEPKELID